MSTVFNVWRLSTYSKDNPDIFCVIGEKLSFSKEVFLLKAKLFPRLKALHSISSLGPSKKPLSLLYKAFLRPLLNNASPVWFS